MNYFFKLIFTIVYLSLGMFWGIAVYYLPDPFMLKRWGTILLLVASVLCPFGMKAFGWIRETPKFSLILFYLVAIVAISIWFFISAITVAMIGVGNG